MTSKDVLELFLKHHGRWEDYQDVYDGSDRIQWELVHAGQTFFTRLGSRRYFNNRQEILDIYDRRWKKMWNDLNLNELRTR